MKKPGIFAFCLALVGALALNIASSTAAPPARIDHVVYWFDTTSNDKDWDTQVGAEIRCPQHAGDIAARWDFNHDKNVDHWSDNTSHGPFDLPLSDNTVLKSTIIHGGCSYRVSAHANCNDRWDFDAHLAVWFTDGTARQWYWPNQSLNSRGCHTTSVDFSMNGRSKGLQSGTLPANRFPSHK